MAKNITYQCPGHAGHPPHQFNYLHHPSVEADPVPRFCGVCGYDSEGDEPEPALATPHIGKTIRATVDNMHRQMEDGAQFRADLAQAEHGFDTADTANMKMTDMRDGLRAGDTSDVPVHNEVSKLMEIAPPGSVGFQGAQGLGYSGPVATGPFPNAGAHAQSALRAAHAKYTAASGQVGATTSSIPALETTSPNYRVRVR